MKKGFLIAGAILVFAGLALLIGAAASVGFDFAKLGAAEYETNTYTPGEAFDRVEIDTDETDIDFRLSEDGACRVVCTEPEKVGHRVSVENGTLKIARNDEREWSDRLVLFSNSQAMTVYLPRARYESLAIVNGTGDIQIPGAFSFGSIDVKTATGGVTCSASAEGTIRIGTSTGGIRIHNASAGNIELSVSSGRIYAGEIECRETVSASVVTGKTQMTDLVCRKLVSEGSTGDIVLKNVTASESFSLARRTGDVSFENCDAGEITVRTTTGDVTGSINSAKVFQVQTDTGSIRVPHTTAGGTCRIKTSTGDIRIDIAGS